uniref:Uncharacterized protein LOC111129544 n=1 Tax=Crassostrea virginica TaxID=6565 RepID=A0A8B8DXI3_CRAVI|nr:uncharacterized protein LOC111129544 [Crassostrea virginica]
MNVSSEAQTIFRNTVVGVTSNINDVKNVFDNHDNGRVSCATALRGEQNIPDHLLELYEGVSKDLNQEQRAKIKVTLAKYQHIFSKDKHDFGRTSLVKHKINTEGAKPTKQPLRRLPHHAAEFVDQEVQSMMKRGIVEPSSSPWAAGVVLVEKKDGTKRFVWTTDL